MRAHCQYCKGTFDVDAEYVGYSVRCQHCGRETVAMSDAQVERNRRNRVVSNRMGQDVRTSDGTLFVCFFLGVLLNALGVALASVVGGKPGMFAALRGMVYSFLLALAVVVLKVYMG